MLNVLAMQENLLKMKGKAVPQKDHEISEAGSMIIDPLRSSWVLRGAWQLVHLGA